MDLLDFFRGVHSWRKCQVLLDGLPSASHFREAMADDDEVAEANAELLDAMPSKRQAPALCEYSPEVQRLDDLLDLVHSFAAMVGAKGTDARPRTRPVPRPETAFTRLRDRRSTERLDALTAEAMAAIARPDNEGT